MLVHWGSKFTRRLREHFAWISRRSSLQICCLIFSRSGWSTTGWFFDIYSLDRTASFKLRYCAVSLLNYAKLFIRVLVVIEGFRDVHINRVALCKCQSVNGFSLFETLFSSMRSLLRSGKKIAACICFQNKVTNFVWTYSNTLVGKRAQTLTRKKSQHSNHTNFQSSEVFTI